MAAVGVLWPVEAACFIRQLIACTVLTRALIPHAACLGALAILVTGVMTWEYIDQRSMRLRLTPPPARHHTRANPATSRECGEATGSPRTAQAGGVGDCAETSGRTRDAGGTSAAQQEKGRRPSPSPPPASKRQKVSPHQPPAARQQREQATEEVEERAKQKVEDQQPRSAPAQTPGPAAAGSQGALDSSGEWVAIRVRDAVQRKNCKNSVAKHEWHQWSPTWH